MATDSDLPKAWEVQEAITYSHTKQDRWCRIACALVLAARDLQHRAVCSDETRERWRQIAAVKLPGETE